MTNPHSIYGRIAHGVALLMAVALLGGCVVYTDRDYAGVLATARTDCMGDEIVGVWACSSYAQCNTILLLRPDGTGLTRTIDSHGKSNTTSILWRYQGEGIWTSNGIGGFGATASTIRFAGNALASETKTYSGDKTRYVLIRMGDGSLNDMMKPHP